MTGSQPNWQRLFCARSSSSSSVCQRCAADCASGFCRAFCSTENDYPRLWQNPGALNEKVITSADWQTQAARDLFFIFLSHPEGMTKETGRQYFLAGYKPGRVEAAI
jgi:hypothetical protein